VTLKPPGAADWPLAAGLYAAAMLATAHAFQAAGYAPCTLCLQQREVYWGILAFAAAVIGLRLLLRARMRDGWVALCFAVLFGVSFAAAGYHAGVEWKWWPGPETCATGGAPGTITAEDLAAVLSGEKRVRPPACDEPAWIFAGLSMAGWNAVLSLVMAALSLVVAVRSRETRGVT
jgi:disulfide bond formation protein DsbB